MLIITSILHAHRVLNLPPIFAWTNFPRHNTRPCPKIPLYYVTPYKLHKKTNPKTKNPEREGFAVHAAPQNKAAALNANMGAKAL